MLMGIIQHNLMGKRVIAGVDDAFALTNFHELICE